MAAEGAGGGIARRFQGHFFSAVAIFLLENPSPTGLGDTFTRRKSWIEPAWHEDGVLPGTGRCSRGSGQPGNDGASGPPPGQVAPIHATIVSGAGTTTDTDSIATSSGAT